MYYVYQLFNTLNGKIYIGKSSSDRVRFKEHLKVAKGGKKIYESSFSLIHKALQKYNECIEFSIIQQFECEEETLAAEKYWIEFFKSNVSKYGNEFGYNLTAGGDGVVGFKHSVESKKKMSDAKIGKPSPNKGRILSSEQKLHLSTVNKGKVLSVETREKMSKSFSGRIYSNSRNAKISQSKKLFNKETELEILNKHLAGTSFKDLAQEYGCHWKTISNLIKRIKQV